MAMATAMASAMARAGLAAVLFAALPAHASASDWDEPVDVLPESIQMQAVANGDFDGGLAPWLPGTDSAPDPDAYTAWSPLDHGGDVASGSLQFVNLTPGAGNTFALGADCFQFDDRPFQAIRVRLRYHVPVGSGRLWIELWTGFQGDMPDSEPPCYGPGIWRTLGGPVGTTAGFVEFDSGWLRGFGPIGDIAVGFAPYTPVSAYVAHIDDVRVDIATIAGVFSDGLESATAGATR